jgi:uncharacterized membrane protein YgcG
MRELLYEAAKHYRRGKSLAERGDTRGAGVAFEEALRELQAVRPQRMRDVLLAQVYLSRHQLDPDAAEAPSDLRLGYAYARTTAEPNVRAIAERLWAEAVASGRHRASPKALAAARRDRRPRDAGTPAEGQGREERAREERGRGERGRGGRGKRRGGKGGGTERGGSGLD